MLFWILPIAAAVGVLLIFMIRLLQRYDAETAQLAISRTADLEKKIDELHERLVILEAIESDNLLDVEETQRAIEPSESLSSAGPPISRK